MMLHYAKPEDYKMSREKNIKRTIIFGNGTFVWKLDLPVLMSSGNHERVQN